MARPTSCLWCAQCAVDRARARLIACGRAGTWWPHAGGARVAAHACWQAPAPGWPKRPPATLRLRPLVACLRPRQVFVVADGGADLEHFELRIFEEVRSILLQARRPASVWLHCAAEPGLRGWGQTPGGACWAVLSSFASPPRPARRLPDDTPPPRIPAQMRAWPCRQRWQWRWRRRPASLSTETCTGATCSFGAVRQRRRGTACARGCGAWTWRLPRRAWRCVSARRAAGWQRRGAAAGWAAGQLCHALHTRYLNRASLPLASHPPVSYPSTPPAPPTRSRSSTSRCPACHQLLPRIADRAALLPCCPPPLPPGHAHRLHAVPPGHGDGRGGLLRPGRRPRALQGAQGLRAGAPPAPPLAPVPGGRVAGRAWEATRELSGGPRARRRCAAGRGLDEAPAAGSPKRHPAATGAPFRAAPQTTSHPRHRLPSTPLCRPRRTGA